MRWLEIEILTPAHFAYSIGISQCNIGATGATVATVATSITARLFILPLTVSTEQ